MDGGRKEKVEKKKAECNVHGMGHFRSFLYMISRYYRHSDSVEMIQHNILASASC